MKSKYFWPLLITPMVLATELFAAMPVNAAPKLKKPVRPVVRLGKPYKAELRRKAKLSSFSPQFLRREDANTQYLQWRNSVQFGKLLKK